MSTLLDSVPVALFTSCTSITSTTSSRRMPAARLKLDRSGPLCGYRATRATWPFGRWCALAC